MFLGLDRQRPTAEALVDDTGRRVSYGELTDLVADTAARTEARAPVFLLCRNTVGAVTAYLGLIQGGGVPVLLSDRIDRELLAGLAERYAPPYLCLPEEEAPAFSGEPVLRREGYVLLRTGAPDCPVNERLQMCMTTSGSTGSPKLVRYAAGNLEANARNVAAAFGWTEEERAICDLGMQYTMGLNVINAHLHAGATVLLTTRNLMSAAFWDHIREERGSNFTGVPFSYELLERLRFEAMDLPCLRTLSQGGGKLTDERFRRLAQWARRTGGRFIASFGTTETAARMACLPPELAMEKTGSIGRAIPEVELFLTDEAGRVLTGREAEGELCCRGPNVTLGYARGREDLAKGDEFCGVYRTGDLARRDADGCYYVTGRLSRFLKLLGYRVSLDEAERLISQRFGTECACAGTDRRMNVYLTGGVGETEVLAYLAEKTKLPKSLFRVRTVPELLRGETGKLRYREMDEAYG